MITRRMNKQALRREFDEIVRRVRRKYIDSANTTISIDVNEQQVQVNLLEALIDVLERVRDQEDQDSKKSFLFSIMEEPLFRDMAPHRTRLRFYIHRVTSLAYADGENIVERVGCLLPQRERDQVVGDAVEAIARIRSLSVGKPKRRLAVFGVTAYWAAIIAKNAALFAVSSQLPKRSR